MSVAIENIGFSSREEAVKLAESGVFFQRRSDGNWES